MVRHLGTSEHRSFDKSSCHHCHDEPIGRSSLPKIRGFVFRHQHTALLLVPCDAGWEICGTHSPFLCLSGQFRILVLGYGPQPDCALSAHINKTARGRRLPDNLACNRSGEVTGPLLQRGNLNSAGRDAERLDGLILLVKAI